MGRTVAYIMSRFPHLPETFILREMIGMEEQGWDVALYPLIFQSAEPLIHKEAIPWMARARQTEAASVAAANLRMLVREPGRVFSTFFRVVAGNMSSPGFLARAMFLFPKAVWMAESMRNEGVGHIHAHYATHPALVAWIIHRLTSIPYTVTVHAHDIFVNRTMLGEKLRGAFAVVAISEYNRRFLIQHLGPWITDKIHVIHCGINPAAYAPSRTRAFSGQFEFLTIGSLQPYKGQATLVAACAILAKRGARFRCRIIGGGMLQPSLLAQITGLGLDDCVQLIGPKSQQDVAALLAEADCYVQPSIVASTGKMEGIPVSLMEAMASRVPVVATAISGVPELVQDRETGLLVPPGSPEALADAMQEVMVGREEAQQRAQRAEALVGREFDIRQNVAALSSLMGGLVPEEEMQIAGD